MTSTTTTLDADDLVAATALVKQIAGTRDGGDLKTAYRLSVGGAKLYPGMSIPGVADVWSTLTAGILASLDGVVPVSGIPVSAAPVSAAPVSTPPVAAPVSAPPVVSAPPAAPVVDRELEPGFGFAIFGTGNGALTMDHTVELGTILRGSQKHDGVSEILGKEGQRWSWHRTGKYFYLAKSAGHAADVERMGWAALALRRGGWDVFGDVNNRLPGSDVDAPSKKPSTARFSRIAEVRLAARRQQWVNSAMLIANAPVSGAPARVRPVSAAPVSVAPQSPAPVSTPPVSAVPVSGPRPPVSGPSVLTAPDYAAMTGDELLAAVLGGDLTARSWALNRLNATVSAPVSAPVSVAPAAPVVPQNVTIFGNTAEVWFDATVSGRAMRDAATDLRRALAASVTHQFGERGDRPQPQVFRSKPNKAFRVTITAPEGVDPATLAVKAITAARRIVGVGSVREQIVLSESEMADA